MRALRWGTTNKSRTEPETFHRPDRGLQEVGDPPSLLGDWESSGRTEMDDLETEKNERERGWAGQYREGKRRICLY